jgi:hypothetical protein
MPLNSRKMKNFLYVLFLFALVSSCQKTIEFDGEVKDPKLVVNSIFNTEDTFRVHISNSLSLVDGASLRFIKNATVKLYDENDALVSTPLHTQNGYYMDETFQFEENKQYRVEVERDGFNTITATDKIPATIQVSNVDTQKVVSSEGFEQAQVTVEFDDPEGENFYMVEVRMEYYYKWDSFEYSGWETAYLNTLDPNIEGNTGTGAYYNDKLILKDNNFDGNNYKLRFNVDQYLFENEYRNIEVRFYSLSESVFNYFTSVERYQNVQGNPFATPVQVFSNVENGFGIFGGSSIFTYSLKE